MGDAAKRDEDEVSAFLTVDEAAQLLRVGRHSIYEAVKSGEAPWAKRIGKNIRIHRAALLKWFEADNDVSVLRARRKR